MRMRTFLYYFDDLFTYGRDWKRPKVTNPRVNHGYYLINLMAYYQAMRGEEERNHIPCMVVTSSSLSYEHIMALKIWDSWGKHLLGETIRQIF